MTVLTPARPSPSRNASEAYESLRAARALLAEAGNSVVREPNRMGAWRLVASALQARKALTVHGNICASDGGPLLHLAEARPRLIPAVGHLAEDRHRLISRIDALVALANQAKVTGTGSAQRLRAESARLMAALGAYERRFHAIAFEWANRDIGGEAG